MQRGRQDAMTMTGDVLSPRLSAEEEPLLTMVMDIFQESDVLKLVPRPYLSAAAQRGILHAAPGCDFYDSVLCDHLHCFTLWRIHPTVRTAPAGLAAACEDYLLGHGRLRHRLAARNEWKRRLLEDKNGLPCDDALIRKFRLHPTLDGCTCSLMPGDRPAEAFDKAVPLGDFLKECAQVDLDIGQEIRRAVGHIARHAMAPPRLRSPCAPPPAAVAADVPRQCSGATVSDVDSEEELPDVPLGPLSPSQRCNAGSSAALRRGQPSWSSNRFSPNYRSESDSDDPYVSDDAHEEAADPYDSNGESGS
eukprot:EG_transcript_11464